ncbi:hypothetical protein SAMN05192588_0998 [Nonlabens sp. Hel1_33_55]|uniref:hypothetical protein n=1 Tax=Nonlabens sp. Hel1_33_55 TaxID=1336802 RepID=UPI000875D1A9|nr:hypothetical protein [Nonlabens sp. Hel1_33_55]SCY07265.1 hypothetical protein SAMN05192588_0998 [Nonlabens sp. Hel1_33_55]
MRLPTMSIYCFLYPIMTMAAFLFWLLNFSTDYYEHYETPLLLSYSLLVILIIELPITTIFRKQCQTARCVWVIAACRLIMFELILFLMSGNASILDAIESPIIKNVELAFSMASIVSIVVTASLMHLSLVRKPVNELI